MADKLVVVAGNIGVGKNIDHRKNRPKIWLEHQL